MDSRDKTSIFDGLSQLMPHLEPSQIKPIWSRVLIRDIHDDEKIGSIFIPPGDAGKDLNRLGVVVAVGPGDPFFETNRFDYKDEVIRKELGPCLKCGGGGTRSMSDVMADPEVTSRGVNSKNDPNDKLRVAMTPDGGLRFPRELMNCPVCHGDGKHRIPMQVKVGDRVVYSRRRESEIYVNGERLSLVYEYQSVFMVVED